MNKPRWKFWHQSIKEEKDEIKKAQKDGETSAT